MGTKTGASIFEVNYLLFHMLEVLKSNYICMNFF